MRKGSVIRYAGKRGVSWRLRYRDASGKRVNETLGTDLDGWTKTRAEEALNDRLVAVKREGFRKRDPIAFASFADEWLESYPTMKGLKHSTRDSYKSIVELHLKPALGDSKLSSIDLARLERYVSAKLGAGLAPRTVNRHLNLLHEILATAIKRKLISTNPVRDLERPKEADSEWTILTPTQIGLTARAFAELAEQAEDRVERFWFQQSRVVFLAVVDLGLRRGEILGLRWRDVSLADPEGAKLRVRETFVRNRQDTPKSKKSRRTIALDPDMADELFQHRGRTAFEGEDERVFCHPLTGGPLDPKRYAALLKLALAKAGITARVRPFHDGRHTSLTNAAADGMNSHALMQRAGHSDFSTTLGYINLAGETFRAEAESLGRRIFAAVPESDRAKVGAKDGGEVEPAGEENAPDAALSETGAAGLEPATPGFGDLPTEGEAGESGITRRPSVGLGHVRSAEAGKSRGKS